MRSEREMLAVILDVARRDERVRAAWLNGSRTNPRAPRDEFQDYDVVYLVTEIDSFLAWPAWVDVFGPRLIMQTPEAMALFPPSSPGTFAYLMLFEDHNRIDLTLVPLAALDRVHDDRLVVPLLDKDNRLGPLPPPTDEDHWVKRPSPAFFDDCCNEFWWVCPYVAKGLRRHEFLYAAEHLNAHVRPQLARMLSWEAAAAAGFSISVGKCGKYLDRYVPPAVWTRFRSTFAMASEDALWTALFETAALFRESSRRVAAQLGFAYPDYDEKVTAYLEAVRPAARPA